MTQPPDARTAVVSSLLSSMPYAIEAILDLEFRRGAIYRYFAVPPAVVEGLIAADSKGAYFNRHIRRHFRYQRLAYKPASPAAGPLHTRPPQSACVVDASQHTIRNALTRAFMENWGAASYRRHLTFETVEDRFYFVTSSARKSVWTLVRQLRGPHLSTCA